MNWQEEEIQKRNATNVRTDGLENIAQTNSNIAIKKGNKLWEMFIQKNRKLLPDIRLIENTENGEIVSLKKMSDMNCKQLEFRHDTIFVTGIKYKCRRFTISYHASKGSFIGYLNNITSENSDPTSKYDANTAQFYFDSDCGKSPRRPVCLMALNAQS